MCVCVCVCVCVENGVYIDSINNVLALGPPVSDLK